MYCGAVHCPVTGSTEKSSSESWAFPLQARGTSRAMARKPRGLAEFLRVSFMGALLARKRRFGLCGAGFGRSRASPAERHIAIPPYCHTDCDLRAETMHSDTTTRLCSARTNSHGLPSSTVRDAWNLDHDDPSRRGIDPSIDVNGSHRSDHADTLATKEHIRLHRCRQSIAAQARRRATLSGDLG